MRERLVSWNRDGTVYAELSHRRSRHRLLKVVGRVVAPECRMLAFVSEVYIRPAILRRMIRQNYATV
jgi:hypothetical protein